MGLEDKGMLVRLNIGQWTAAKKDKQATAEVAENHQSDIDMGNYRKALVAKEGLKIVQQVAGAARLFHLANTFPWTFDGVNLLPSDNFIYYRNGISKLKSDFEMATADVLSNYDAMIQDARRRLNGLFNADEYPDSWELEAKYYFRVSFDPIPISSDFRLTLTDGEETRIRQEITDRASRAAETANREAWKRLHDTVLRFVETLPAFDPNAAGKDRGTFRDSLVTNAVELCDLLTRLNITNDPHLETMRKEVEKKLTGYTAKTLREDDRTRAAVTKDAQAILDAIAPFVS
jgi:hypothetical protein